MTDQTIPSGPSSRDAKDYIVLPSIAVFAIAVGVAFNIHLDLPWELAGAAALLVFSAALGTHALIGRQAVAEPVKRRRRRPSAADVETAAATPRASEPAAKDEGEPLDVAAQLVSARADDPAKTPVIETVAAAKSIPPPVPAPSVVAAPVAEAAAPPAAAAPVAAPAPTPAAPAPVEPIVQRVAAPPTPPASPVAAAAPAPEADHEPSPAPARVATTVVAEQERISAVLRRLATQLRAGEPLAVEPSPAAAPGPADPMPTESSLSEAVEALRTTMESMRLAASIPRPAATQAPATDQASIPSLAGIRPGHDRTELGDDAGYGPAPSFEAELRVAAIADALDRERVDVFLEPIIGLTDDSARHFEVSVRLRGPDDRWLDTRSLALTARGSEILPVLDAVRVRHSAGIALKIDRSGREGSVFSEVTGPSLKSERFVQGVAERQAQGIADRIVLTFAQNEVRGLGPAQIAALTELRDLGFRFALQGVADLDMDFEVLHATGFEFVKLDADVFLDGLPLLGGRVPSSDICRHFASLGMTVIVGRVDDESMRARILGFGVLFGQGQLFGGARPVRVGHGGRSREGAGAAA